MNILLLSHGKMAEGICDSIKMVCGGAPKIGYECLREEEGIVTFKERLSQRLDEIAGEFLCILTDIRGGSPYTACLELLQEKGLFDRAIVISGMNLPLVIGLAFGKEDMTRREIEDILREAGEQMEIFQISSDDEDDL